MRIQKKFQGKIPDNKILNMFSKSLTDTYSCDFINNIIGTGEITVVEQDPTVPEFIKNLTQDDIDRWNNNTGGIVTETDPTVPSHVKSITQDDIEKWNNPTVGITEELDPTVPSHVKNITEEDINNWNNPTVGITEETDPVFIQSPAYNITQDDIDKWNSGTGGGTTEETDPTVPDFVKNITQEDIDNWNNNSNDLGITIEDINNWNNKQDALVSGVNIKTIDNKSLLGSGNISTEYFAGKGISITDRVITNTITSYNDLTDLPFIPTKITDLEGVEDFPFIDPENPEYGSNWARVDINNNFKTDQTINGDVSAEKVNSATQVSVSTLGIYKESDGSYTLGKVAE